MAYFIFLITAAFTIFFSMQLAKYGDVIERKGNLSAILIGLLIGGATSLPEITSSITSISLNEPNLALANAYGSNLFNLLVLASVDLCFIRKRVYNTMNKEQRLTGVLVIVLSAFSMVAILTKIPFKLITVGIETIFLLIIYVIGVKIIGRYREEEKEEDENEDEGISLKKASIFFAIAAIFIMLFGSILTISVDRIAEITGLGTSFAGTFFLAAATSLPEAIASFTAVKLNNIKLLIAGIYGSNLFNLLIAIFTDAIYVKGSIYQAAQPVHLFTLLGGLTLMLISLMSATKKNIASKYYSIPSIILVILYFFFSYLIFINS
ncbi:MAG: sodium:calcium antiporter [Bacillaceae bacterium]